MTSLSDRTLEHLVRAIDLPDLTGTRYEILEELGRGGMGAVYAARDPELERRVALKVLHPALSDEKTGRRMIREARILARLEHPGIVPVHEVGRLADGRVYYTMKLVEGERLDRVVARISSLRERLRIFGRFCEAVAFAHARGVVHRDLKPSNVMVGPFGEVLVMDWGVAKIVHDREREAVPRGLDSPGRDATRPGSVLGTPGYMAPEQMAGQVDLIDRRTDVYALGVILNELVQHADRKVSRRLLAIRDKATRRARDERYSSVEELSADVSSFLDGESVSAYREGPLEVLARWFHRYRAPILLLLAYLVARVLILVMFGT